MTVFNNPYRGRRSLEVREAIDYMQTLIVHGSQPCTILQIAEEARRAGNMEKLVDSVNILPELINLRLPGQSTTASILFLRADKGGSETGAAAAPSGK